MVDVLPEFDGSDNRGSTVQQSGTVGTTNIQIPAVATTAVSEFIIQCPDDQDIDNRLLVSMDGGANVITLQPSGHLAWTPKGSSVTQIDIVGNQAGVKYEIIINLEET